MKTNAAFLGGTLASLYSASRPASVWIAPAPPPRKAERTNKDDILNFTVMFEMIMVMVEMVMPVAIAQHTHTGASRHPQYQGDQRKNIRRQGCVAGEPCPHTCRWLFGMRRWRLNWFHSDCRLTIATAGRPCHRKAANEEKNDCGGFAFAIEMYPAAPARLTFRVKCIRVSLP